MSNGDIQHARSRESRGLSVRGGDSDKWVTIQKNTFTNWVNLQLQGSGYTVTDFEEDFDDGVKLCALVEALQHKKIGKVIKKPINHHQSLENVSLALKAIADDNVRLVNIGSEDIVNGSLKLILGLVWTLILRYQIGKTKFSPKKLMLAWLKAVIPECHITNFTSDWNDGVALSALIEYCQPGLFPDWRSVNRRNRLDNCTIAMNKAREQLDVPMLLRPEDLASPHLDELSGMTYLSFYMRQDSPGYFATRREVRKILQAGSIENFTTDWNDGRLLCNLVMSVGGSIPGWPDLPNDPVGNLQKGLDEGQRLGVEPIFSATEIADPEVEHLGVMAYAAYYTRLTPVKLKWIPATLVAHLDSAYVGREKTFEVQLEDGSADQISAVVTGPDSSPGVDINWSGSVAVCSFTPVETGQHKLDVLCGDNSISGSPVSFLVMADRSRVVFYPPGRTCVGHNAELKVDVSGAGQGDVRMEAHSPSGRLQTISPLYRPSVYEADFIPSEVGVWVISVFYDGEHISGSPFELKVFDPSLVNVYGLEGGSIGQALTFSADASTAGEGDVDVKVFYDGSQLTSYIRSDDNGRYSIDFTPQGPGQYLVYAYMNDVEVRGSPFTMEIVDSARVTFSGEGISLVPVNRGTSFTIHTNGAGSDKLNVDIAAPTGEQLDSSLVQNADGDYRVEWTPKQPGRHTVEILFGGQRVTGSPFYIEVFDISRIRVDSFFNGIVGEQAGFSVDASQAGQCEQSVRVTDPSGNGIPVSVGDGYQAGQYNITYVPEEAGQHLIHLTYNSLELPGSPFTQNIGEGALPSAHGTGLYRGEEDKSAVFYIDSRGMKGEPTVQVDGPNSMAKCSIDPQSDGQYAVTYVPVEVGMYDIQIRWNGKEIPGSPYHAKVVCARKVLVVGGWQHYMDSKERVSLIVNEEKQIPFDVSQAGPGTMTAEVKGPSGAIPVSIDDTTVGRNVLLFTPQEEGLHYIHVYWSETPLVENPITGFAVNGAQDSSKIILSGRGLKEAVVREEAEFMIDASRAGSGEPGVQLTGVSTEVNAFITPLGGSKYRCTYIPVVPGAYLLHITWNSRQLRGSPYKVNVIGAFYPNKVIVTGNGLRGGQLGQPLDIQIDTRKAGPGELTAYCMGPNKVAVCELEDHHDGTFRLTVRPQDVGSHVLQVKYGGEHVLGSPFSFKVAAMPDASKVRVSGPGVEHGILATFQSRFVVETRGAGAGQLTVRVRGPKGAFQVEMYRDSQKDRIILCRYDPAETGLYIVSVRWSGTDVPGSPFHVQILDTQAELEHVLSDLNFHNASFNSSRPGTGYGQRKE